MRGDIAFRHVESVKASEVGQESDAVIGNLLAVAQEEYAEGSQRHKEKQVVISKIWENLF